MSKLPRGILKTGEEIRAALEIAKGMGMVDPAQGGKAKAASNSAKLEARNLAMFQSFVELRDADIAAGKSAKQARADALKQLEINGQDPTLEGDPLSIQQIRKIIKAYGG